MDNDSALHTARNTEEEHEYLLWGVPPKTYTMSILIILALVSLFWLLLKYTSLGFMFSRKKRKKRQKVNAELQKILYGQSNIRAQNIYTAYGPLGQSNWPQDT